MKQRSWLLKSMSVIVGLVFAVKLFILQVWDNTYRLAAENNVASQVIAYPYRGLIYDRHDNLLVHNAPIYDVMVIPREVNNLNLDVFKGLLDCSTQTLVRRLEEARAYSTLKPSLFIEGLYEKEMAQISGQLIDMPGFYIQARGVRGYGTPYLAGVLGSMATTLPRRPSIK